MTAPQNTRDDQTNPEDVVDAEVLDDEELELDDAVNGEDGEDITDPETAEQNDAESAAQRQPSGRTNTCVFMRSGIPIAAV